jgi:hypothetical protein
LTCPNNQELFAARWAEVGGLLSFPCPAFLPVSTADFPLYVPLIRPGIIRTRPLNSVFVGLSLYEVLRALKNGRGYEEMSGIAFRRKLALRDDARILVVGVGGDAKIENFWRHHAKLTSLFRPLDLVAVTVPNFSYFTDVPREHILYNRKRSLLLTERLLAAGVPVIPHFNATAWGDWRFAADLLRQADRFSIFCKEFQTGNRLKVNREEAVAEMASMQKESGKPIHPILVGGVDALPLLKKHFGGKFTLMNSTPSMRTNNRQIIDVQPGNRIVWRKITSKAKKCIASLLDHNVNAYTRTMERRIHAQSETPAIPRPAKNPQELLLALS